MFRQNYLNAYLGLGTDGFLSIRWHVKGGGAWGDWGRDAEKIIPGKPP